MKKTKVKEVVRVVKKIKKAEPKKVLVETFDPSIPESKQRHLR